MIKLRSNTVKPHVNFEEYAAKMDNSHTNKALIIPYIKGGSIVDFGAGTGRLAEMIKSVKSTSYITAVETDPAMQDILYNVPGVDRVVSKLEDVDNSVDTVIFNSVLHEVESYAKVPYVSSLESMRPQSDLVKTLKAASVLLPSQGRIIIRDGFLSISKKKMSARLLDNDFDVDYYIKNYPFAKSLERVGNRVEGDFNEMKEFLNKLTWGMDSLPREICERINFLTCHQWADLLTESGFNIISINAYMQPSYFYHLQKVAEISNTWETHVLIVAEKK